MNHRTENLINKAKLIKQPLTNSRQVNLPFSVLGMMECLVVADTWFKVDERSNETVDLGKLVPEIEQKNSTGWQQCTAYSWRSMVWSVSLNTKNVARGNGKALLAKQGRMNPRAQKYQTRKKHWDAESSIPTTYE
jgi:hypothetical protein